MKSIFGNQLQISLFGESHQDVIGCTIHGLASGILLDMAFIQSVMHLRKAKGNLTTQRQEEDEIQIVSGLFNGYTTGTPLTILIQNTKQHSSDYTKWVRPSHADYTAEIKYQGFQDYRGGGHFSGRITAPLVAAGAICLQILNQKGIYVGSHILELHGVLDRTWNMQTMPEDIESCYKNELPVLDIKQIPVLKKHIEEVKENKDSIGGIIETVIYNMEAGIGEPFFDSLESTLSHLLFSVGGVKGVEFGLGFDFKNTLGSQANDAFYYEQGMVKTKTNHSGGINGGISNGMPIQIKSVIKPTPSIYQKQATIDLSSKSNMELEIVGRHDPAIILRANIVISCLVAIGIVDAYSIRYGYMWMK